MVIKNLGQVAAIFVGPTPPTNTNMIWRDSNTGIPYFYSSSLPGWVSLVGGVDVSALEVRVDDLETDVADIYVQLASLDGGFHDQNTDTDLDLGGTYHVTAQEIREFIDSKGQANGLAQLDGSGLIPLSVLPYEFESGVNDSSGSVRLGGALLEDAIIDASNFNLEIDFTSVSTSSKASQLYLNRKTSGTAANGIGGGLSVGVQNDAGDLTYGQLIYSLEDVADGVENSSWVLNGHSAGTLVKFLEVNSETGATAIGTNVSGSGSGIAIGQLAQLNNDANIAIGYSALAGSGTKGQKIVAIGHNVGYDSNVGSNSVNIGEGAVGTEDYSISIGAGISSSAQGAINIGYHFGTPSENNIADSVGFTFNSESPDVLFAKSQESFINNNFGLVIGSNTQPTSAILSLESESKALLLTRISDESEIVSPENGFIYYNTSLGRFRLYEGGVWKNVTAPVLGGYNTIQNSGTSVLQRIVINVENGLTAVDDAVNNKTNIRLGGTLNQATQILGNGQTLSIGTVASKLQSFSVEVDNDMSILADGSSIKISQTPNRFFDISSTGFTLDNDSTSIFTLEDEISTIHIEHSSASGIEGILKLSRGSVLDSENSIGAALQFEVESATGDSFVEGQIGYVLSDATLASASAHFIFSGKSSGSDVNYFKIGHGVSYIANTDGLVIGDINIESSAILELESTTKALLISRISDEGNIDIPIDGMMYYNTTLQKFRIYENGAWADIGGAGAGAVDSVNGQVGVVVLDTDDISEGLANLYYTNTRARNAVGLILSSEFDYDAGVPSISIADNGVANSKIRQSSGLSIVGRSANSTGNVADITGTDHQILRVSGTTLGFGSIDLSQSDSVGTSILGIANGGTGSANGAWLLAGTSTLTASTIIESNSPNRLVFNGTWSATANNQRHIQINPTITGSSTSGHSTFGVSIMPSLTRGASGNDIYGVIIDPTFNTGGFASGQQIPLLVGSTSAGLRITAASISTNNAANLRLGATTSALTVASSGRVEFGTGTVSETRYGVVLDGPRGLTDGGGTLYLKTRIGHETPNSSSPRFYGLYSNGATQSDWVFDASFYLQRWDNSFNPSASASDFHSGYWRTTVNQTGTANGNVCWLTYDPNETAVVGNHYGIRILSTTAKSGFGISDPTALIDIAASSTARSSLRIRSGTAPTAPNDGDIWFDGADIKMQVGGVTKTFTLV